jgi:hypothetical protein
LRSFCNFSPAVFSSSNDPCPGFPGILNSTCQMLLSAKKTLKVFVGDAIP